MRIITIASSGEDEESNGVTEGAPSQQIDDGEASGIASFEQAGDFSSAGVTGFEVGDAILGREAGLSDLGALERQEDEAAKEEEGAITEGDDEGRVKVTTGTRRSYGEGGLGREGRSVRRRKGERMKT